MSSPFQQQFSAKSPLNQGLIRKNDNRPREVINAEIKKAIEKREESMRKPKPTVIDKLSKKDTRPFKPSTELTAKDSAPLNQITVGENTGEVEEDKKGNYVLRSERSIAGAKGDTIRIPNNKLIQDGYLIGGDYETKKLGDKSFEITKQK
mgnify:FL=1